MTHEVLVHKGKDIHYLNHEGISGEPLVESIRQANDYILERNNILVIVDFTKCFADRPVMEELKSDQSKAAAKKAKRIAVLGVDGIKKILLNAYNQLTGSDTRAFGSLEQAKDFLAGL